ncbi:transposase [uncultured Kriegella sp.]|uniref:transposase n=1 Tax=uncultured Kriegella sp. TaxID=1798910 RepID=UPI0030D825FB
MQGKKDYQEKPFSHFQLSERIPKNNFYRRLKGVLNLNFLYKQTKDYYFESGQKSIDLVVFFKLCLVGYLENLISDLKLIAHCSMRLDIFYFIRYDIDEELPWHCTINRTRQLFSESVFEEVFTMDLLYLTGHRVKSVLVIKINFEKCQEKKEITLQSLRKKL